MRQSKELCGAEHIMMGVMPAKNDMDWENRHA